MKKTEILADILKLAGFVSIKIEMERGDGVSYSGEGYRILPDGEKEVISFQGTNFPTALAHLLATLYDTENIDFETNAAIIFGD